MWNVCFFHIDCRVLTLSFLTIIKKHVVRRSTANLFDWKLHSGFLFKCPSLLMLSWIFFSNRMYSKFFKNCFYRMMVGFCELMFAIDCELLVLFKFPDSACLKQDKLHVFFVVVFFNIYHKGTINTGSVWGFITELPSFSLFQPLELKHFFKLVASLNKPCGQLIMTEFFFNIQLPLIIWVQCYLLERLASSFQIPTNWLNLKLHLNAQTNETKINNCFFFVIFY